MRMHLSFSNYIIHGCPVSLSVFPCVILLLLLMTKESITDSQFVVATKCKCPFSIIILCPFIKSLCQSRYYVIVILPLKSPKVTTISLRSTSSMISWRPSNELPLLCASHQFKANKLQTRERKRDNTKNVKRRVERKRERERLTELCNARVAVATQ